LIAAHRAGLRKLFGTVASDGGRFLREAEESARLVGAGLREVTVDARMRATSPVPEPLLGARR
jgi:hypothetical protein